MGTKTLVRACVAIVVVAALQVWLPAGAATDGLPDPAPSGPDCEWMGSATWERTITSGNPEYQLSQDNFDRYAFVSVPSASGCVSTWSAVSRMDAVDIDPCGEGTTMSWTWDVDASGSGSGTYTADLLPMGDGTYYPSIFGYSDGPFTGSQTLTYVNDCGDGDDVVVTPVELTWSIIAGWCQGEGSSGSWLIPSGDAQVMVGSCEFRSSSGGGTGYSSESVDTWTWSFRRAVCDRSVDTDGGGVGDCDEHDAGTDPYDPEDDGRADRDGDGFFDDEDQCPDDPGVAPAGCPDVDTDRDGFLDSVDRCISVPGVASAGGCPDADGDGASDYDEDNCLGTANPGQEDFDGDGAGDACDPDADGDDYPDAQEGPASLDPRDPDTDDDTVVDGHDDCPTTAGSPTARGCPLFAELLVEASYAFTGSGGFLGGGIDADLRGSAIGVVAIDQVCFRLTWEASSTGTSSAQLLWNGAPAAGLDQTTPPDDAVVDVRNDVKKKKFEQEVAMSYCTAPTPTGTGLVASYPWNLFVGGPGGTVQHIELDDVVVTVIGNGAVISTVGLDDNKTKGKQLQASWSERETERVEL